MNTHKALAQALAIAMLCSLLYAQIQPQCNDYCYIKESALGKCSICYTDCEHSTKAQFLSCSIVPINQSQNLTLTQTECKQQCYPETYPTQSKQPLNSQQLPITLEQLQKMKKETEGWISPSQSLVNAMLIMFTSSILFIAGFILVWRQVDKRRKIKQLKQKQQKEWVKCFEKVNSSDTTICSIDAKETTMVVGE